jgi:hypothetical protein
MLISFTKFCATATIRFFLIGFAYTGALFLIYGHSNLAPEFLQGGVTGFEIASVLFGIACIVAATLVALRFIGRKLAEIAFRRLFV